MLKTHSRQPFLKDPEFLNGARAHKSASGATSASIPLLKRWVRGGTHRFLTRRIPKGKLHVFLRRLVDTGRLR